MVLQNLWFIVHQSSKSSFNFSQERLLDVPPFASHPNRDDLVSEFVCIRLDPEQLCGQQDTVLGRFHVQRRRRCPRLNLPWLYGNSLFFFLPVSAECMADPLKISEALERGWIFQECTFGRFDEVLVKELSVHLAGWKTIEVKTYLWTILEVSYLLERRGYDKIFERNIPDITNYWGEGDYYGGVAAEPFRLLGGKKAMDLFKELKYSGEEDVSWTVKHVLQHCVGNTPDEVFAFLSSNP